jgi:hypothetical protein
VTRFPTLFKDFAACTKEYLHKKEELVSRRHSAVLSFFLIYFFLDVAFLVFVYKK